MDQLLFVLGLIAVIILILLAFFALTFVFATKLTLKVLRWVKSLLSPSRRASPHDTRRPPRADESSDPQRPIADRVLFWEEQDRINQELIPRVVRQADLLAQHIKDHENLLELAGKAVQAALAEASEEQRRHYEAAIAAARSDVVKHIQPDLVAMESHLNTSIELKLETVSRQYRQRLLTLVGISAILALISSAALILAIVT